MSYQPGMDMPMFTVMGIEGAEGKTKATSSNLPRRRQFSARNVQPAPLSPRPCTQIRVAVCFLRAGMTMARGVVIVGDVGGSDDVWKVAHKQ